MENPYSWDNEKLLKEFMNTCSYAGFSGSGIVIDVTAGESVSGAHYLKGVLKARLEGLKPPFNPGDIVKPNKEKLRPSDKNSWKRSRNERSLSIQLTVNKVHYLGDNSWNLTFLGKDPSTTDVERICDQDGAWTNHYPLLFDAKDFVLAQPEAIPVPA